MKSIVCNLKVARDSVGLTQDQLADRIGVSRAMLRKIEYGEIIPNVLLALTISKEVNQEVSYLFQQVEVGKSASAVIKKQFTPKTSLVDQAIKNGISSSIYAHRILDLGWDDIRASTEPPSTAEKNGYWVV